MVCTVPIRQDSPPLGTNTVIDAPGGLLMVKAASLRSLMDGSSTLEIFTKQLPDAGPVTVQLCEPSLGVLAKTAQPLRNGQPGR